MRPSPRTLAIIYRNAPPTSGAGAYLVAHNPTGLTGLPTHPFPRPTLLNLYTSTLRTLAAMPAHSIYRQATENLTKQRLAVIEKTTPAGFEEWQLKTKELLKQYPALGAPGRVFETLKGEVYVLPREEKEFDDRVQEWQGEKDTEGRGEGPRPEKERRAQAREFGAGKKAAEMQEPVFEVVNEPALTAEQVNSIEQQIGAGLLEEIIEVAESELHLAQVMLESKAWEELEEKPAPEQWAYFARDRHTGITQTPSVG